MKMGKLTRAVPVLLVVLAVYGSALATDPNLIAHWKFDEGEGLTAYDSAGNNDGTLVDGPEWTLSGIDGSLMFDGVDDYVNIGQPESLENMGKGTVVLWFKPDTNIDDTLDTYLSLFEKNRYGAAYDGDTTLAFTRHSGDQGRLSIDITNDTGGHFIVYSDSSFWPAGAWQHVAATWDNGTGAIRMLINGVEQSDRTDDFAGITMSAPRDVTMGGNSEKTMYWWDGAMDDVRVYDRALSPNDISQLYLSASPVSYYYVDGFDGDDLNDGQTPETAFEHIQTGIDTAEDGDTVLVYPAVYTEPVDFNSRAITVQGVATEAGVPIVDTPMDYAFSFTNDEEPNSVLKNFVVRNSYLALFLIDSAPTIRNLTIVDNWMGAEAYAGSEPDISNCIFYNSTSGDLFGCEAQYSWTQEGTGPIDDSNLVAHWKFDEGEGLTAYDSAGTNDGTIYGATWTSGQIGGALDFDGLDDYINLGSPGALNITDEISISMWVKAGAIPDDAFWAIVSSQDHDNESGIAVALDGRLNPDGQPSPRRHIHFQFGNGNYWQDYCTTNVNALVPTDRWVHIVATRRANEDAKVYYNSVSQPLTSKPWDGTVNYTLDWNIGRMPDLGGRNYLDGLVDDVHIYDRALSAEEVQQVYEYGLGPMFADPCNDDYHLLSERGRYWPEHDVWVLDDVTSPCVDGGDPNDNPADERMPNGGRINMGVYGGTAYASMSEWPLKSDTDRDGRVSMMDFAILAGEWLEELDWLE
ncbi:MAG: LamG domain-containing protein [Planctomycetota bacterium]|jgi:hypothetical protein